MLKTSPAHPLPLENIREEKFIESEEFFAAKGLRHLGLFRADYTRQFGNECSTKFIEDSIKAEFAYNLQREYPNATHIFEYHAAMISRVRKPFMATDHGDGIDISDMRFYITANAYENPNGKRK